MLASLVLHLGALTGTLTGGLGSAGLLSSGSIRLDPEELHAMAPAVRMAWSAAVTHDLHRGDRTAVAGAMALPSAYFIREVPLADNRPGVQRPPS